MDVPVSSDPQAAPTLSEVRSRHLDLLEDWTPDEAAALAERAEALRREARVLGRWLDDPDDRDRAQGIIDYWTASLISIPGLAFPETLHIDPFDPDLAHAAAALAEAVLTPHAGTALEQDAGEMLLCLVRTGPGDRIFVRAPVERADLIPAARPAEAAARQAQLLDRLVAAGTVRRTEGGAGAEDRFEFAHGSVARAWPRMRDLLDRESAQLGERDRFRAAARLWEDRGRDPGLLLGGSSLGAAGKYAADDPELTEFVVASRKAADKRRRQWVLGLTVGPALGVALLIGSFSVGNIKGFGRAGALEQSEINQAETPNIEQLDEAAVAAQPDSAPSERIAPGPSGWIYAGNRELPLLGDESTGEALDPTDPAAVAGGNRYRVRTDIRLRADHPDDAYASAPAIGVVPNGWIVAVTGEPRTYDRASGRQVWVPVQVVPRVYIHYADARPDAVEALRDRLRESGFETPPVERLPLASGLAQVRYFRKDDGALAVRLARELAATVRRPDGAAVALDCVLLPARIPTAQLEIWLDLRNLRLGAPVEIPEAPCESTEVGRSR